MSESSSRLVRLAPAVGAGSAVAAVAVAAVLAAGVVHDAHATTSTSVSTTTDNGSQYGGNDSTGGLGVPSQQQGPVARSNGS